MTGAVLVAVHTHLISDPRVSRQVRWLLDEGWTVDTIALGETLDGVRTHYGIAPQARWTSGRIGRGVMYAALPERRKHGVLRTDRVPKAAIRSISDGAYDLVVLNDIDFLPWLGDPRIFSDGAARTRVHVDLHEYFPQRLPPGSRLRIGVDSQHRWVRSFIGHPRITTRSTVASAIADAYVEEFGFDRPGVVRNAPPFVDQDPSPVDPGRIRLVHHGVAQWKRGLRELVAAMRLAPAGYELTFMLAGSDAVIEELRASAADIPDRVRIVPPVPMESLPREINQYDLEVMFYPPLTDNLRFSLPNKLFEAVQGRLGLLIGQSPMMADIVRAYGNGEIVEGWNPEDLASTLSRLTPDRVEELKRASHRVAHELSAEHEARVFLEVAGAAARGAG